ncbi:MAG: FAD-binding oxidoreductase [Thermoplasmata archaeon]|nr:FAD-binding oxidoreductase [Thermoplasmata archaeon]
MDPALRSSLQRTVRGTVTTRPTELNRLGRDASHVHGAPGAVVRPIDAEDVAELVGWARQHRMALVPRGAGTSLDGESVALGGAVVVDLSGWKGIGDVGPGDRSVRVGPGVVNRALHTALEPAGLFFPPNPGSWETCTIGGNLGTNASGPRSFRYGPTRHWVSEVEAVLGTGEKVRLGRRVEKRSMGPDLLQLFIGSEGTLGIATEVTLRLAPRPARRTGLALPLPVDASLGRLARALARAPGTGLSAVEYLDEFSAEGLVVGRGARWATGSPLLLLEVEGEDTAESAVHIVRVSAALRASGILTEPTVIEEADRLWSLRGENGRVLDERLGPHVRDDVAVPFDRLDELVAAVRTIALDEEVRVYLFGHLGEGNLHPNYAVDPASRTADRIRAALYAAVLRLGGTISAEHGVGRVKREFLGHELGTTAVRLLRAVKDACDPDGILNPGKLYPSGPPTTGGSSPSPSGGGGGPGRPASPSGAPSRPERSAPKRGRRARSR